MDFGDLALFFRMSSTLARLYGGGAGCFTPGQPVSVTKISIINRVSQGLCRNAVSAAPGPRTKNVQILKNKPVQNRSPDPLFFYFGFESWGGFGSV